MRINSYFSNALFNRDKLASPKGFVPGANPHAAVGGLVETAPQNPARKFYCYPVSGKENLMGIVLHLRQPPPGQCLFDWRLHGAP